MTQDETPDEPQRFIYVVRAIVVIDLAVVDYLMDCSKRHYDHHCRSVGAEGGFLYGWNNRLKFDDEPTTEVTASFRELDTLAKLSEISMPNGNAAVHFGLRKILNAINEEIVNLRDLGAPTHKQPPFSLAGLFPIIDTACSPV